MAWEIEKWEEPCEAPTLYYGRDCEVTKIELWGRGFGEGEMRYTVVFNVPDWVAPLEYPRGIYTHISARDELEAFQKFREKRFV